MLLMKEKTSPAHRSSFSQVGSPITCGIKVGWWSGFIWAKQASADGLKIVTYDHGCHRIQKVIRFSRKFANVGGLKVSRPKLSFVTVLSCSVLVSARSRGLSRPLTLESFAVHLTTIADSTCYLRPNGRGGVRRYKTIEGCFGQWLGQLGESWVRECLVQV